MVEGYYEIEKFLIDSNLCEYYVDIFNMHFVYWITSLVISDISDDEKLELVSSANDLLKKDVKVIPGFNERIYNNLTKPILEDDYKSIVKALNSIKRYRGILRYISGNLLKTRR